MQVAPPPPKSIFLSLPPEIRNSVYELLVFKPIPIRVCSPRRKHVVNKELTSKLFSVLLRLNKQINTEACTIFYSKNEFVFGNGQWGSTKAPNVHGLKAFLDRVPKRYLVHITNVVVEIHCRVTYRLAPFGLFSWVPAISHDISELGTKNDATNLHSVSRALGTHFSGLERVTYRKRNEGASLYTAKDPETRGLSKEEVVKQLEKTLILLLKNTKLKEVKFFSDRWVDMKTAAENVISVKPDAIEVLKEELRHAKSS